MFTFLLKDISDYTIVANRRRKVNKGPDEKKKRRTIRLTDNR